MRKIFCMMVAAALILSFSYSFAASGIPNLVGTWSVTSEGYALIKGAKADAKSHWGPEQKNLKATAKILEQNGRIIKGEFVSDRAREAFIAIIGGDNKTIYYADENGILDLKIIGKDRMQGVYRQVTADDVVVAFGVWKRIK